MKYTLELVDGCFVGTTSGAAEVAAFKSLLDEMLGHPAWRPGSPVIHDHTDLDAGQMTVNEVQQVADACVERRERLGAAKFAVVVGRDLEFGLARMWGTFVDQRWDADANVVRSLDEAWAWLAS